MMEPEISENEKNLLPPADFNGEIEKLQEELLIERDRNLRARADFKNYSRRVENDAARVTKECKREIILPLLGIVDDIEKALQVANDPEQPFVKGVRIIHNKFLALLQTQGVCAFETTDLPFDHNRHEAVAMVKDAKCESGIIVDELRRGYLMNNELLRAAQVRVAE
jgi:molecular chaperone GrpE